MLYMLSSPSSLGWSTTVKVRLTSRVSPPPPPPPSAGGSATYSGRDPAKARSTRPEAIAGTIWAHMSIMRSTSAGGTEMSSALATCSEVVPRMATSCWGTMMSPSAGLRQALITPRTYRLAITTITPLPAIMVRGTPAILPTSPAQAPAALTTHWQPIVRSSPATASCTRTAVIRSSVRSIPTIGWRTSTLQPLASASAAIERSSDQESMPPSGTAKASLTSGASSGSRRWEAAADSSSVGIPEARQPSTNCPA